MTDDHEQVDEEVEAAPRVSLAVRAAWQWAAWKIRRKNQAAVLNPVTALRERVKLK
jgi:hypothetical protein